MKFAPIFRRFLIVLFFSLPAWATAATLGTDYVTLDRPVPADNRHGVEVVEVFSFACPHCFDLEPLLRTWIAQNRGKIHFVGVPVVASPAGEPMARAFYAAQMLGKEWPYREALFNAIHKQFQDWRNPQTLLNAAQKAGIDRKRFEAMMNSFTVQSKVNRARQLTEAYGVTGVPTIIVGGQFRTSPAYTSGDYKKMLAIVDDLVKQVKNDQ